MKKTSPAKRPASKSVVKKTVKPSAKPQRVSSVSRSDSYEHTGTIWTKPFLKKEQDEFHVSHPNSKILLAIFICTMLIFFYAAYMDRVELFPELFMM